MYCVVNSFDCDTVRKQAKESEFQQRRTIPHQVAWFSTLYWRVLLPRDLHMGDGTAIKATNATSSLDYWDCVWQERSDRNLEPGFPINGYHFYGANIAIWNQRRIEKAAEFNRYAQSYHFEFGKCRSGKWICFFFISIEMSLRKKNNWVRCSFPMPVVLVATSLTLSSFVFYFKVSTYLSQ